jgi:DNA-binding NarL/FixJ family response regulator
VGDTTAGAPRIHSSVTPADPDDPRQLHLAGTASTFAGDDRLAFELLHRSVARARDRGQLSTLSHTLMNLASLEVWKADYAAAAACAAESADLARTVGQSHWVAQAHALEAWIAAVQGRREDCERLTADAVEIATYRRVRAPVAIALWARALSAMGAAEWTDAMTALEAVADNDSADFHPMYAFLSAGDLVETSLRVDRRDVARATLDLFESFASGTKATWASAVAARCRGLLSEGDDAVAHFEEALTRHAESERRFDEARTRLLYGEYLRRARRRSDAREHLRRALDAFERLGAAPWGERARGELRATGETARRREPDSFAQLTPQQTQIVRLVKEGSTNKEVAAQLFLSPRTVDYHLRNVFVKLGITSRAELMRVTLS